MEFLATLRLHHPVDSKTRQTGHSGGEHNILWPNCDIDIIFSHTPDFLVNNITFDLFTIVQSESVNTQAGVHRLWSNYQLFTDLWTKSGRSWI